jgi:hypothetical protein
MNNFPKKIRALIFRWGGVSALNNDYPRRTMSFRFYHEMPSISISVSHKKYYRHYLPEYKWIKGRTLYIEDNMLKFTGFTAWQLILDLKQRARTLKHVKYTSQI